MTQRDTQFRHSNRNNSYQRSERMFQTLQLSQFPFLGILGNLSYFRCNSRLVIVIQAVYEIQKIFTISSHKISLSVKFAKIIFLKLTCFVPNFLSFLFNRIIFNLKKNFRSHISGLKWGSRREEVTQWRSYG